MFDRAAPLVFTCATFYMQKRIVRPAGLPARATPRHAARATLLLGFRGAVPPVSVKAQDGGQEGVAKRLPRLGVSRACALGVIEPLRRGERRGKRNDKQGEPNMSH